MTTPQTSNRPTPLESSDPWIAGGVGAIVRGLKRITDWIGELSPAGANYDTGWVNITPASGFSATNAQICRVGRFVYARGFLSGALGTTAVTVGTVPAGFAPVGGADDTVSSVGLGSGGLARATVNAAGTISVIAPSSVTTAVYLKGLSGYRVV